MLYYIKLKDGNNERPYYNKAGWKSHQTLATVYVSRNGAKAAASREGLDQDEFEIKLLYLRDIIDEVRRHTTQAEYLDLIIKGDRNEIESKYKEILRATSERDII